MENFNMLNDSLMNLTVNFHFNLIISRMEHIIPLTILVISRIHNSLLINEDNSYLLP